MAESLIRSIWKPSIWRSTGQTDVFEGEPYPSIPDTCPAVRSLILNNLDLHDLKMVRQVCSSLKADTEELVGISARFEPYEAEPKPAGFISRLLKYFSPKYRRPSVSPEEMTAAKAEGMEAWLPKVTVKSLSIRRLSVFPLFEPTSLKHPLRLQRLVLDFDEKILPELLLFQVIQMLDLFDNLAVLKITCRPPYVQNDDAYRTAVSSLLEDVRLGLQFKPKLKELSLVVNVAWAPVELQLVEPSEDLQLGLNFPKGLRTLELSLPTRLYPQKASNWKSLLDGQEGLERLKIDLGFVNWRHYIGSLQKNAESLRHLDLFLSAAVNNEQLRNAPAAPEQWLDWKQLAMVRNLESLRIYGPGVESTPGRTETGNFRLRSLDFSSLGLPHVQRLELGSIFLGPPEFEKIFFGLPSLQHVLLEFWSEHAELVEARGNPFVQVESFERAQYICDVLARALPLNRFQTIRLVDYMVSHYPQFLRDRVPKLPNYDVVWTEKPFSLWMFLPLSKVRGVTITRI